MKRLAKIKRLQPTGSGGYFWDHGSSAFGDPLEAIARNAAKKEKQRKEQSDFWYAMRFRKNNN